MSRGHVLSLNKSNPIQYYWTSLESIHSYGRTLFEWKSQRSLGLWWDSRLSFKKHISVLKTVQGGSEPYPSGHSLEVGRGQRHAFDAVPGHCTLQAGLGLYCVWHCIEYQFTTTGQHSQLWAETGIGSILYQPSVQPIHRGQRSSFGGTSVKAVHALLCENSCLHWQSGTSCPAWIRPNH